MKENHIRKVRKSEKRKVMNIGKTITFIKLKVGIKSEIFGYIKP